MLKLRPVLWAAALPLAIAGCLPAPSETPAPSPAQAAKEVAAGADVSGVVTLSAAQFNRLSEPPANLPLTAKYYPGSEWSASSNPEDSVFYYGPCAPGAVDRMVGLIAAEGQRRVARAQGELLLLRIQEDALRSTRSTYASAQERCGFNYGKRIKELDAAIAQNDANQSKLFAPRSPRGNAGDVAGVIGGIAGIIGASGGSGGRATGDCPATHTVCK